MSDVNIEQYADDANNIDMYRPGIIEYGDENVQEMVIPGIIGIDNKPTESGKIELICPDGDIDCILEQYPPGAGAPGIEIINAGTETKVTELFGFKLDENDDAFSVGAVLLIVVIVYVAKGFIDEFFARRLERYKKKIE
jgi:hypothetical protein